MVAPAGTFIPAGPTARIVSPSTRRSAASARRRAASSNRPPRITATRALVFVFFIANLP
jgi:hypothetical protein